MRHVVLDLSTTDMTYETGDSLGVFARKNPKLVQAVLAGWAPAASSRS